MGVGWDKAEQAILGAFAKVVQLERAGFIFAIGPAKFLKIGLRGHRVDMWANETAVMPERYALGWRIDVFCVAVIGAKGREKAGEGQHQVGETQKDR